MNFRRENAAILIRKRKMRQKTKNQNTSRSLKPLKSSGQFAKAANLRQFRHTFQTPQYDCPTKPAQKIAHQQNIPAAVSQYKEKNKERNKKKTEVNEWREKGKKIPIRFEKSYLCFIKPTQSLQKIPEITSNTVKILKNKKKIKLSVSKQ